MKKSIFFEFSNFPYRTHLRRPRKSSGKHSNVGSRLAEQAVFHASSRQVRLHLPSRTVPPHPEDVGSHGSPFWRSVDDRRQTAVCQRLFPSGTRCSTWDGRLFVFEGGREEVVEEALLRVETQRIVLCSEEQETDD